MNRLQFWVLTYSILLVVPFFIADIFLSRYVHEEERKAGQLERFAQEGSVYTNRWQQLAMRIYQGSQQDPALRQILIRQQVNVVTKSPNVAPATETSSPAPRSQAQPASNGGESIPNKTPSR